MKRKSYILEHKNQDIGWAKRICRIHKQQRTCQKHIKSATDFFDSEIQKKKIPDPLIITY